jgi:hypothetical protein
MPGSKLRGVRLKIPLRWYLIHALIHAPCGSDFVDFTQCHADKFGYHQIVTYLPNHGRAPRN